MYHNDTFKQSVIGVKSSSSKNTGQPFHIQAKNWAVTQDEKSLSRFYMRGASHSADRQPFHYNLNLTSSGVGGDGAVPMGDAGKEPLGFDSLHLATTNLSAVGVVSIGEHKFKVEGSLWLQHMWGTANSSSQGGFSNNSGRYDWIYAQLDNGIVLQLSDLGNGNGSYTNVPGSYINVVFPNGTNWLGLKARGDWSMTRSRPWKSPHSKDIYWMRRELSVSSLGLKLTISTLSDDNEVLVGPDASNAVYYDGASIAEGTMSGKRVYGKAWSGLNHHHHLTQLSREK